MTDDEEIHTAHARGPLAHLACPCLPCVHYRIVVVKRTRTMPRERLEALITEMRRQGTPCG